MDLSNKALPRERAGVRALRPPADSESESHRDFHRSGISPYVLWQRKGGFSGISGESLLMARPGIFHNALVFTIYPIFPGRSLSRAVTAALPSRPPRERHPGPGPWRSPPGGLAEPPGLPPTPGTI